MLHNSELRLKARSGQDRGVNQRNARTTDKDSQNGWIYSLISRNNKLKRELRKCADMAEWVAVVEDNSAVNRALSLNLMQKTYGAVSYDDKKPTVMCANQNIVDVYWGLLQPHQRLMSEEMSGIGFENVLTFNGIPVLIDSHQAANTMYFLNEDFLKLYVHSSEDMRFEKIVQIEAQAATLGRIFWAGNLVCNGRRYQGSLADLLTS